MTPSNNVDAGSGLPEYTITYLVDTAAALAGLERLRRAEYVVADTETVARDAAGALIDLNIAGPGPVRVLSMAGKVDGVVESYVFDLATGADIDPNVTVAYGVSGTTGIDRAAIAAVLAEMDLYAWNADFDERVLDDAGIPPRRWRDLMLSQASLALGESGVSFYDGLAYAAKRHLGVDVEGKGSVQLSYTKDLPLDPDQVRYAALDAVVTSALVPVLGALVESAGLVETVELEWNARPFRSRMERRGIYFDVSGWREHLGPIQEAIDASGANLAQLTGGGQANLFDPVEKPLWNPGSTEDTKKILNQYAADSVRKRLGGRLFEKPDSVDNATLQMLSHPIADGILEWRNSQKTLSTYGEKFLTFVRGDGRVHARYLQSVVSTGRMASAKPNMQNLDPAMKPYFRPETTLERIGGTWKGSDDARVFVMGDLSQAELRFAAQISGDQALVEAFVRGDDMHVVTASRMFQVDVAAMKDSDPKEYKIFRQRGKTMNFAVIYGLGPAALAQTLTLAGVATTDDEAQKLLDLYLKAFPAMALWLEGRDADIKAITDSPPRCDFGLTLRLQKLLPKIAIAKKAMAGRDSFSTRDIVLEITPESEIAAQVADKLGRAAEASEVEEELERRIMMVDWASQFRAPVVIAADRTALSFQSRTTLGRRRTFNVTTTRWLDSIINSVVRAKRSPLMEIRMGFEAESGEKLSNENGSPLSREVLKKRFEKKELKDAFVSYIFRSLGSSADDVCYRAIADCIGGLGNAYRNAPIQGGVADAVMLAFGLLDERLADFDDAHPVQSVHDSIVIECRASEAIEVAAVLQASMVEALQYFCPSVPAVADVEIASSLDAGRDLIENADLLALY